MSIFTVTASSAITFAQDTDKFDWSLLLDYQVFDGTEAITFRRKTGQVRNDSGTLTETITSTTVGNALRREVNGRDVMKHPGILTERDTKWELPVFQLATEPQVGDRIDDGAGNTWNVILVDRSTLTSRWRCFGRRV